MMNQQRTGEFLKQLRKGKGLTQEQLAEHFFVSSRTVSRWETGSNMHPFLFQTHGIPNQDSLQPYKHFS